MVYALITMIPNQREAKALSEYKRVAKRVRDENGAEVVFRMNIGKNLLGDLEAKTFRIIKFPSEEHITCWLNDPRYQEVIPLRDKAFHLVTLNILENIG